MDVILLLGLTVVIVWFWTDSMHAREMALRHCTKLCRQMDVQLLDQTVRLARLRIGKNQKGHIQFRRFYVYELSTDGVDRWYGIAILLGQNLEYLRMEHPQGPIIQDSTS